MKIRTGLWSRTRSIYSWDRLEPGPFVCFKLWWISNAKCVLRVNFSMFPRFICLQTAVKIYITKINGISTLYLVTLFDTTPLIFLHINHNSYADYDVLPSEVIFILVLSSLKLLFRPYASWVKLVLCRVVYRKARRKQTDRPGPHILLLPDLLNRHQQVSRIKALWCLWNCLLADGWEWGFWR